MSIEAIFQNGVFKPLSAVSLPDNQRVQLEVKSLEPQDFQAWLAEVKQTHEQIIRQRGFFPDSAPDIAADRVSHE